MSVVAVDLAAKYSAACYMNDDGSVLEQADSWQMSMDGFLIWVSNFWSNIFTPDILIIEDIPHALFRGGSASAKTVKRVCQLQGRIEQLMLGNGCVDKVLFVPPATWLRSYEIKTLKDAAKQVQPKAEEFGYVPPLDYTQFKGKDRQLARKVNTDYSASFLIARWAIQYKKDFGTFDAPNTERFSHGN